MVKKLARTMVLVMVLVLLGACAGGGTKSAGDAATSTSTTAGSSRSTADQRCATATTAPGGSGGPEVNPPGDIPDNQAFVAFLPTGGQYTIKIPEGWARSDGADKVTFSDKFNSVGVQLVSAPAAPSVDSATSTEVPALAKSTPCFEAGTVSQVSLPAGPAVKITYKADAPPDAVTGKIVRDDVERYELWRAGTVAVITLSGSAGSDNVDPWRLVTRSFAWQ